MKNKENKRANRVIKDMKECFQSFHLPVKEAQSETNYPFRCDFLVEIDNDNVVATIMVKYDRYREVININIANSFIIKPGRVNEVLKLLNMLNGTMPLYQCCTCPCCNELSIHASLHLTGNRLAKDKFKRFIRLLLEDTYIIYPLIARMLMAGGSPEDFYARFMDNHKDLMDRGNKLTSEMEDKILEEVKLMFDDFDITIKDEDRVDDGYIMELVYQKNPELFLRTATRLYSENEAVVISMAPPFSVPDDKFDIILELVNRINRVCSTDHMYISGQSKKIVLLKGVMLNNGVIDKEELKIAFGTMLTNGFGLFPIINEQLTSDESPETLMRKLMACYLNNITTH